MGFGAWGLGVGVWGLAHVRAKGADSGFRAKVDDCSRWCIRAPRVFMGFLRGIWFRGL